MLMMHSCSDTAGCTASYESTWVMCPAPNGLEDLYLSLISPYGTGLTEHAQIKEVGYTCRKWCFPEAMEMLLILHAAYVCPYLSKKALAVFQCHLQNH